MANALGQGGVYGVGQGGGSSTEPGLVLVDSDAFSGASSVSIDGCFTGSYTNYRVVVNVTAVSAATQYFLLRLRVGGVDASGAGTYVYGGFFGQSGTTGTGDQNGTGTAFRGVFHFGDDSKSLSIYDIARPAVADVTPITLYGGVIETSGLGSVSLMGGGHQVATAYDGFTLFPASGTMTGIVRVFGVRDS